MKKIRSYKYIVLMLMLMGLTTSCFDKLDVNPETTIDANDALKTSSDVEGLLVGAYDALGDGDLYGGNILRDSELISDDWDGDDSEVFWDGTFVAPGDIWVKAMLVNNDQAQSTYLDAYTTINICNTVLANLDLVTEDRVERVEGEAKFIRAALYFELARTYGRTWTDGDPTQNPGVPITLVPITLDNAYDKIGRSSVATVYNQVIADFNDAAMLLPEENGFYANRFAALGMLSRVYSMQNDYAKATAYADTILQTSSYKLEDKYEDAFNFTSPATSSEDIFSLQVTPQDGVNNMNNFFASSDYGGRGDIYINLYHIELYEPGDDRLNLFYDDYERTGKWKNQFGNVNILRLAEMYLTRAEGNLREGTTVGADPLDDINTIRRRVGLSDLVIVTIDDVLKERHLELAFEGLRMHDTKRTQGDVGTYPYNDPKLIFPIPQRELNINPDLEQNESYGN